MPDPPSPKDAHSPPPSPQTSENITLIGTGTIGLSLAALHLARNPSAHLTLYDTRPDLAAYISTHLPAYLSSLSIPAAQHSAYTARLRIASTLQDAVRHADYIQEQGPETPAFKTALWPEIESLAPLSAIFWSSTSGIPASVQSARMADPSRLLVVHPYNPPHIMPLLELVPSPSTSTSTLDKTSAYFTRLGRKPVVLRKECTGFVANRLAFALFREACSLVAAGVVGPADLDEVVTSSMGPRWAVAGPFRSYAAGGGEGGLRAFMEKIGGTVGECWRAGDEDVRRLGIEVGEGGEWLERVCGSVEEEIGSGRVELRGRDERTLRVLEGARWEGEEGRDEGEMQK